MIKVYVAGKLSHDTTIGYIQNMHNMIKFAAELRAIGVSVYVPANDFLEGLVHGGFEYEDYFGNSQPWLLASDAVVLVPGWETSPDTKREIALAEKNNIPVYKNIDDFKDDFFDDKIKSVYGKRE